MFRALWKGWRVIAKKIGEFQSRLILLLLYFVVMAPFALAIRLFSDPLHLRGNPSWHPLSREGQAMPSLNAVKQQF